MPTILRREGIKLFLPFGNSLHFLINRCSVPWSNDILADTWNGEVPTCKVFA